MNYFLGVFDFLLDFSEYLGNFNKSVVVLLFGGVSLIIGYFLLRFGLRKVRDDINDGVGVLSVFFSTVYILFVGGLIVVHFIDKITEFLSYIF